MARYSYPIAKLHVKQHGAYILRFTKVLNDFKENKDLAALTTEITTMLDWFLEHIQEHDVRMSFYCKARAVNMRSKKRPLLLCDSARKSEVLVEFFETFGLSKFIETGDTNKAFDIMSKQQISLLICTSNAEYFALQPLLKRLKERNFEIPLLLIAGADNSEKWGQLMKDYHRPKLNCLTTEPIDIPSLVRHLDGWLFPYNQGAVELMLQEE